jgi:hypothetical protein
VTGILLDAAAAMNPVVAELSTYCYSTLFVMDHGVEFDVDDGFSCHFIISYLLTSFVVYNYQVDNSLRPQPQPLSKCFLTTIDLFNIRRFPSEDSGRWFINTIFHSLYFFFDNFFIRTYIYLFYPIDEIDIFIVLGRIAEQFG